MERASVMPVSQSLIAICVLAFSLPGFSTPVKMSSSHLNAIGVHDGAMYWIAEQKLSQEGYSCYISGANRKNFDCTKTTGFFPTCLLRIVFQADDRNLVANLSTRDPACLGTP